MKSGIIIALALAVGLGACTGAKTVTHKPWEKHKNILYLKDITVQDNSFEDAGARLRLALENRLDDSLFILGEEPQKAKYQLKYKITQFKKGSRLKRLATLGIDDDSRAQLDVKVALVGKEGILGAWQVKTWVKGGVTGGSPDQLFSKAAEQILQHMRGY